MKTDVDGGATGSSARLFAGSRLPFWEYYGACGEGTIMFKHALAEVRLVCVLQTVVNHTSSSVVLCMSSTVPFSDLCVIVKSRGECCAIDVEDAGT